jgi:uncharacterized glyoxalase superfamily protein PhnB
MDREAHIRDAHIPLEATSHGREARRRAFARPSLRRARIRSHAGLRRIRRGDGPPARVVPTIRYRDVPAAVAWLCRAFGMQEHRVVADEAGAPRYAELRFGGSLVMIAPIEETAFGRLMVQPDELGGVETQVCYLCVDNVQAHYTRARTAGAVVVIDPDDEANNGRGYSCRDPEGHVWNFGSYDPWQNARAQSRGRPQGREPHALAALLLVSLAAVLAGDALPPAPSARAGAMLAEARVVEPAAVGWQRRQTAEAPAIERERRAEAEADGAALKAAEKMVAEVRAGLAEAQGAEAKAQREAAAVRAQLAGALSAKAAAERAAREARSLLAGAEADAKEARAQAALEQKRRLAADQAAARSRRRVAAFRIIRPQPRVWCYSSNAPNPASNRGARLSGFCKG